MILSRYTVFLPRYQYFKIFCKIQVKSRIRVKCFYSQDINVILGDVNYRVVYIVLRILSLILITKCGQSLKTLCNRRTNVYSNYMFYYAHIYTRTYNGQEVVIKGKVINNLPNYRV